MGRRRRVGAAGAGGSFELELLQRTLVASGQLLMQFEDASSPCLPSVMCSPGSTPTITTPPLLEQHAAPAIRRASRAGRQLVARHWRGTGAALARHWRGMRQAVEERLRIESELQAAAGQLVVEFQPQVDAHAHIVGAEALVRWGHPEVGRISPELLIPLAGQTMLIEEIGQRVLEPGLAALAVCRLSSGSPRSPTSGPSARR